MKTPHSAAALLIGALAAALPAISAEPPKAGARLVGGSGLVKSEAAPFAPRSDASVPNLQSFTSEPLRKRSEPFVRPKRDLGADRFETVFFARTRPIRIRIVTLNDGKSFLAKWDETLHTLFDAFDRNRDGKLDAREVELVYSKQEVKAMLAGGFGFRAQNGGAMPALDALDKEGDGAVSFEEFAHYYGEVTPDLARTREAPAYSTPDQLTPELFARLDTNGDQKLSEAELRNAEKLLIPLDGDEDECVSAFEITSNPVKVKSPILAPGGAGMEMMARPGSGPSGPTNILSYAGPLPGSVVQALLKRYDKDGDYELSRTEIALPKEAFDKLDTDGDDQLDAKELEAWRTGSPDFTVELNTGPKPEGCTAKLIPAKGAEQTGIEFAKQTTPERLVVRVFGQTLDLSAGTTTAPYAQPGNPYAYLFPAGKEYLVEKDLVGPQYQMLRVLFDPADWNGDGKLTRAEFDRSG